MLQINIKRERGKKIKKHELESNSFYNEYKTIRREFWIRVWKVQKFISRFYITNNVKRTERHDWRKYEFSGKDNNGDWKREFIITIRNIDKKILCENRYFYQERKTFAKIKSVVKVWYSSCSSLGTDSFTSSSFLRRQ